MYEGYNERRPARERVGAPLEHSWRDALGRTPDVRGPEAVRGEGAAQPAAQLLKRRELSGAAYARQDAPHHSVLKLDTVMNIPVIQHSSKREEPLPSSGPSAPTGEHALPLTAARAPERRPETPTDTTGPSCRCASANSSRESSPSPFTS